MELSVGNNIPVDLMDGAEASIDYEIFSDKVTNLVSTVTGLDLPSTDKNLAAITAGTRQDAELSSEFGSSFIGQINVDSQSFNSVDDVINITFFERLKTIFDDIDITIGDIGDGGTFDWNFDIAGNVPLNPTSGKWFLTAGDFNGFSEGGEKMFGDIPLYPAKVISHINQMFWTIDLYSFIDKVFTYYGIEHALTAKDIVFGTNTFSSLYMFIPVTKFVCTNRELGKRSTSVGVDIAYKSVDDGLFSFYNGNISPPPAENGLEQLLLQNNSTTTRNTHIIGASDTKYSISIADLGIGIGGNVTMWSEHSKDQYATPVSIPLTSEQGTVDAILEVYNNDSLVKTITLAELFNGTSGSLNVFKDTDFESESFELDLFSADDISFKLNYKFNGYYFYDTQGTPDATNLKVLNGTYTYDDLSFICENVNAPDIKVGYGLFPITSITVVLTATDQLVPVRRDYDYSAFSFQDEIDVDASLAHTGHNVKELLADISKRYNLGWWVDSEYKIHISNIDNRYDKTSVVSLYESSGEPYTLEYLIDSVGTFEYKNDVGGIKTLLIEDSDEYNIGDIIETEIGGGDNNISVSMQSSIATDQIYGDAIVADDVSLLNINPNYFFWGYSNNQQLKPDDIPIMHGFLSKNKYSMNAIINHTSSFNLGTEAEPDLQVITAYTKNGRRINSEQQFRQAAYYYPSVIGITNETVKLADDDGIMDVSLPLYRNFKYLFDEDQSTITIEGILSHEEMSKLLDGSIAQINGLGGHDANYMVLRVEGFLFDQYKSVVKLKIKKYVTSF